jgi:hypothetical protein
MNAGNGQADYSEQRDMTPPWRPAPPMPPARPRRGVGFIIGMIVAGIGGVLVLGFMFVACVAILAPSSTNSSSSPPAAVGPQDSASAPQQAAPVASFGDGTYRVGPGYDILPGRYRTPGSGQAGVLESCYWERNANDSGQFEAIIANENFNGPASVSVRSGEYLKVSGGCLWTKTN